MRTVIFSGLLCFVVAASTAQTVLLNSILDTMIWEVKKGRACDTVMKVQQNEIESLGRELVANGKALSLSQSSNSTLSALLNNSRESQEILSMQFQKDLKEEKKKTRRWRRIGIIQAVVIITIILTPNI